MKFKGSQRKTGEQTGEQNRKMLHNSKLFPGSPLKSTQFYAESDVDRQALQERFMPS